MILDRKKIRIGIPELLMSLLALLYLIGIRQWFPVCAAMSETVMSCHWAGEALKAVSVLLFALSVLHLLIPDLKMKLGMDLSLLGLGVLTMLLPGHVIRICAKTEMACRSRSLPWTVAFGVAWILVIFVDMVFLYTRMDGQRHQRQQRSNA